MMFKPALIILSLGMGACAAGGGSSSKPKPSPDGGLTSTPSSAIKLIENGSYLLTQNESAGEVVVPNQIPGTVEITLNSCFDHVTKGYFKDTQGQVFPFTQFGIMVKDESRGPQGCKDTFAINLPVMNEITGTINFEYIQASQSKAFNRSFSVVTRDKIKFEGGSTVEPNKPEPNDKFEDDKCGGPCENLIAEFMDHVLGKETRVYSDVFARNQVATILFKGTAQKGEFTISSGSFVLNEGRYEIRQKRLVLSSSSGTATLEFAYLPIQDTGRPTPTATLYAKEKPELNKTPYYIW